MLTILVLSQTGKVKGCLFFRILVRTSIVQVSVKSSFVNEASGESEVMSTERSLSAAKYTWEGNTKCVDPDSASLGLYWI